MRLGEKLILCEILPAPACGFTPLRILSGLRLCQLPLLFLLIINVFLTKGALPRSH